MIDACPISGKQVNETVARLNALLTIALLALQVALGLPWFSVFLVIDFFIRAFISPRHSPLSLFNRLLARALGLPPKPVDMAPKRFAAGIGFVLSAAIAGFAFLGNSIAALALIAVIVFCAALEAFFAFCVGCKVYMLLQGVGLVKPAEREVA